MKGKHACSRACLQKGMSWRTRPHQCERGRWYSGMCTWVTKSSFPSHHGWGSALHLVATSSHRAYKLAEESPKCNDGRPSRYVPRVNITWIRRDEERGKYASHAEICKRLQHGEWESPLLPPMAENTGLQQGGGRSEDNLSGGVGEALEEITWGTCRVSASRRLSGQAGHTPFGMFVRAISFL